MKPLLRCLALVALVFTSQLHAQVPRLVNYQGRITVGATNFDGAGQFKFALVNSDGTVTFWSNDGTSVGGSEPTGAVTLGVSKGAYSVLLGDTALANMITIPMSVFTNPDVRVRVWFNDGASGTQLLTPDQRLAPDAYLADGTVSAAKLISVADWGRFSVMTITNPGGLKDGLGTNTAAVGVDKVLVSAPGRKVGGTTVGGAYLFDLTGNLLKAFDNPTPSARDGFGTAIAAVGTDRVVITAPGPSSLPFMRGKACLFDLQGNLLVTMTNPNSNANTVDGFGSAAVAVGSDKVLIADNSAVRLFGLSGNLLRTFNPPTPGGAFGNPLAAVGSDKVLIAQRGFQGSIGRVYLYGLAGNLLTTYDNPKPLPLEFFGTAITAVGADKVLISTGSNMGNVGGQVYGAYLFDLAGTLLKTFDTFPIPDSFAPAPYVAGVETDKFLVGARLYDVTGTLLKTFTEPGTQRPIDHGTPIGTDKLIFAVSNKLCLFTASSYSPGVIADGARGGSVTSDSLAAGAVLHDKLAANAVEGGNIKVGTIDALKLSTPLPPHAGELLSSDGLEFFWTGPFRDVITPNGGGFYFNGGKVGIGTDSPLTQLHVFDPDPTHSVSARIQTSGSTNSWTRVEFANGDGQWNVGTSRGFNGNEFYVQREGLPISFALDARGFSSRFTVADFYLGHASRRGAPGRALVDFKDALVINFANDWGTTIIGGTVTEVKTLRITGGADLAEPFEMKEEALEKGSVVVIDEAHAGLLKRSTRAYDRRVAGIISGGKGIKPGIALQQEGALEGGQNVALSGRVYVLADATDSPIQPGDLLTTSDTPGCAMKATDQTRAQGAIIGKAMSALSEGQGMVLVLVTLQ